MKRLPLLAWPNGLLLVLLLAAAPYAGAQDAPPGMFETFAGQMAMTNLLFENSTGRIVRDNANSRGAATKSLPFTPTAPLQQQTVQRYASRLRAKSPAAAQAIGANFGPGKYDYGTIYRGLIAGYNLRENDAADATAAYLVLGWMIVNNVQNDKAVTPAMVQGARAQLAPRLAANAQLTAPGAAAQVGEEMKLQSVVVQAGWLAAIKENKLPAYRQGIAEQFKTHYKLDLSQLKLTPQGFASKGAAASPAPATSAPAAAKPAGSTPAAATGSGAAAGAQWFFRAVSSGGGGLTFEPVVLLANGQ